jgi:uncharacterized membrane protein
MMMYRGVDYSIYIYIIIGIALITIPYLEQYIKGIKSGKKVEHEITKLEKEDNTPTLENTAKLEEVEDKSSLEVSNSKKELEERLKLAQKLLNEDEFKILKIIQENEGVTQDSIHFKTGFSHSKISMIMKKLEESDLIIRERFGKTYKLYLSEWLKNGDA